MIYVDTDNNINVCGFDIRMIHSKDILNIFSDASSRKWMAQTACCYGAVAVCEDTIIDEIFRINSDTTVPAAECRGVRLALELANKYRYQFKTINIFCDSQLTIYSLRYYIHENWVYNPIDHLLYTSKGNIRPVKNQELYVECTDMLRNLSVTNYINLYHINGHIGNSKNDLYKACDTIRNSNNIRGNVSYNVVRYTSTYNNYVDEKSRSILRRTNLSGVDYKDAVSFYPMYGYNNIMQVVNRIPQDKVN